MAGSRFAALGGQVYIPFMRAVVQRVVRAQVTVAGAIVGQIGPGLLVLVAVAADDETADLHYTAEKIVALRIFDDDAGVMNRTLRDSEGQILAVSQFTLYGDVRRGRRPSWSRAAPPAVAEPMYQAFLTELRRLTPRVASGTFRSTMQVELVNDGPVTILVDSRKLF
jgi:D-tyrosyl-tRNA(Tyr) deacylase